MSKAPVSKNGAPEHIVGRTAWDAVSEALGFVKLYAHLIIILGLATFTIYKFYEITAAAQHENVKRLNEFGALLNQTHDTAGKLRSSQVADLERQFDLTGKAMKRSDAAKLEAEQAEANAKRANEKAEKAEADAKKATDKVAEAEEKAKEIRASLVAQTSKLKSTQDDLGRVKGSVLELAEAIRGERWPEVAGKLNGLLIEAGSSFDQRIEKALKNLKSPESSPPATPGLDNSLLANPIAPPKIERQLSPTLIAQIQRTLCIEVSGVIGDEDSDTRSALSQFFEGYDYELAPEESRSRGRKGARVPAPIKPITPPQRLSPIAPPEPLPYIIDTPERLAAISAAVDKYERCKKHGLKNAFEVGLFSHLGEKRINNALLKAASLAKIPVKETDKKWTIVEMRPIVEKLRSKYELNRGVDGNDADLIDSDLLDNMYEVSQGRPPILPPPTPATVSFIARVQSALCVDKTGAIRESTNTAVRSYLLGMRRNVPENIDLNSPELQPSLQAAIDDVGNCTTAGFKNAYEVGRFGVPGASSSSRIMRFQERLNDALRQLSAPISVAPTGKLDGQTRLGVTEFRKINGRPGGDEIDEDLFKLVLVSITR